MADGPLPHLQLSTQGLLDVSRQLALCSGVQPSQLVALSGAGPLKRSGVRTPAASGARIQSRKGYFAPYRAN